MEEGPEVDRDRSLVCQGRRGGDGKKEDYHQQEKLLSDDHGSLKIVMVSVVSDSKKPVSFPTTPVPITSTYSKRRSR
jgi:hypothetical protein